MPFLKRVDGGAQGATSTAKTSELYRRSPKSRYLSAALGPIQLFTPKKRHRLSPPKYFCQDWRAVASRIASSFHFSLHSTHKLLEAPLAYHAGHKLRSHHQNPQGQKGNSPPKESSMGVLYGQNIKVKLARPHSTGAPPRYRSRGPHNRHFIFQSRIGEMGGTQHVRGIRQFCERSAAHVR